jgi:hypothetical protein
MTTPVSIPNPMATDPIGLLAQFSSMAGAANDQQAVFKEAESVLRALIGHRLFTLMVVLPGGAEVERVYSSIPAAYPLTGRKPMGATHWGQRVIEGRKLWLGRDMEAIRWAFFDHELIASLGCGACINVPVCSMGEVIGTMNILDRENAYDERHAGLAQAAVSALVPAFLRCIGR